MRAWILGVALAGATGGGVAFVLAGKAEQSHCGPCVEATPATDCGDDGCPHCKATPPSDATDVTDVSALLAGSVDATRPRVSFEEPPFARPVTVAGPELAPLPRGVAEECPMPRPAVAGEEAPMPRAAE